MMRRIALALLVVLGIVGAANAQTSPNFSPGQIPTSQQWNTLFSSKQDYLGSPALPTGGGAMTGELTTAASTTATAGLNLPQGAAPSAPVNGDVWMTSAGLFIRFNGSTVGPLGLSVCSGCAATNVVNTFTAQQIINLNVTTLPAALTNTILSLGGADATTARLQIAAFGGIPAFTAVTYGGTDASKAAVTSGTEVGAFNAWAWNGAALTTTAIASFHIYAGENISAGAQGSKACIGTTPLTTATIADSLCQQGSGGITIGNPTGGDKGAGTINAAGSIFVNNVVLAAGGTVNAGTAGNLVFYATTSSAVSAATSVNIPSAASGNLRLGVAGSVVGSLGLFNATSGSITLQPPIGALGSAVLTVPDFTDTIAVLGQTQTFSGALTLSNTVNHTGAFQVNGNAMTFPAAAATLASLTTVDQVLSGGANVTFFSNGSVASGTTTIDCGKSPLQAITITGAITIAAPLNDSSCMLLVNATVQPTFSGFTVTANVGDVWVNGPYMIISIFRINGVASYVQKAI